MPRLQSSRIALSESVRPWGWAWYGQNVFGASWLERVGRGMMFLSYLARENVVCPGGLKIIWIQQKAKIMKLIAGSLLIVASAILFLVRIQAEQPTNGEWFNWAIQLATRCGLVLCVLGSAFIVWGIGEEAFRILRKNKTGEARA